MTGDWFESQIEALRFRELISVVDWAEQNFRLTTAYAIQGAFTAYKWQREPLNAITTYNEVVFIGPVQTGKSMLGEIIIGFLVDTSTINMMLCYSKKEVVEDVFDERLKPFVREIPAMRRYWSGNEDDLTKRRIKLTHLIIRIASSAVRNDIATHNAGFVYGAELSKWPEKDFDQVKMLTGRTQATRMVGKTVKMLLETSPLYEGDKSFIEAHKPGTLYLKPFFPCPHCGEYQALTDSQVIERLNNKGEKDHDTNRIRMTGAAFYQCAHCKGEILDEHRYAMMERVVWAAPKIERGSLKQAAESITPDGVVHGRKRARRIVFNWNRFVDLSWTFPEALATYFDALNSPNPEALKTYRNEDMADWVRVAARQLADRFIAGKQAQYKQIGRGEDAYVPDGVRVMLIGVDTQDNGFYFVVRGFGLNLESWLIREQFVHCDMKDDLYQNPGAVWETLIGEINRFPFKKRNNRTIPILFGLIDRGGHRARDVDYIVEHTPFLRAYIGTPAKNAPLIEEKGGGVYWGHTERLSRIVQKQMESNLWHLPAAVSNDYVQQITNQYDEEYTDQRGNQKTRWVTKDPDHFRDCENYITAVLYEESLGLQSQLFHVETADQLEHIISEARRPETPEDRRKRAAAEPGTPTEQQRRADENAHRITSDYLGEVMGGMNQW